MPMVRPISPPTPVIVVRRLLSFEDEENHVGGDRQLRHLERHRNDHAQNRATDHNALFAIRVSGVGANWRLNHSREPNGTIAVPTGRCTDRAHLAGGPLMIATADAPMRKRSWSGFSTSMRTGNRCATRTQFSSRFT